jgi:hypothetical protein
VNPAGRIATWALLGLALAVRPAAAAAEEEYVRRMERAARVEYQEYPRPPGKPRHPGNTRFSMSYKAQWSYAVARAKREGKLLLRITPKVRSARVQVSHRIRVPAGTPIYDTRPGSLIHHEYDHVAVSADGRPRLLLEGLILAAGPIEVEAVPGEKLERGRINALIREEFDRRKDAVSELIRRNYELLDEVSVHGRKAIPDRAAFFAELYSRERLSETGFPYLKEAESLLAGEEYSRARADYRD